MSKTEIPDYKIVQVEKLVPYARNSRTHSPEQVAQIAASIKEFGFLNPIIVDGDNGIVAGHGRVLAAQKLGLTELPCIEAKHLTDAQRKAYVIADNKLALNAGWDNELLKIEIDELLAADFDISLLGWGDEMPDFEVVPDYSILDEEDMSGELAEMSSNVKKAIQIEFEQEHYEEAQALVKWWRSQGAYVGMMLIDKLKQERLKHENN